MAFENLNPQLKNMLGSSGGVSAARVGNPLTLLQFGDLLLIHLGEKVPSDGAVLSGVSSRDKPCCSLFLWGLVVDEACQPKAP